MNVGRLSNLNYIESGAFLPLVLCWSILILAGCSSSSWAALFFLRFIPMDAMLPSQICHRTTTKNISSVGSCSSYLHLYLGLSQVFPSKYILFWTWVYPRSYLPCPDFHPSKNESTQYILLAIQMTYGGKKILPRFMMGEVYDYFIQKLTEEQVR